METTVANKWEAEIVETWKTSRLPGFIIIRLWNGYLEAVPEDQHPKIGDKVEVHDLTFVDKSGIALYLNRCFLKKR